MLLLFTGIDAKRLYRECSLGECDMEVCFKVLNALVSSGWQLIDAKLLNSNHEALVLPVDAFDGKPLEESLFQLKREWEELLH